MPLPRDVAAAQALAQQAIGLFPEKSIRQREDEDAWRLLRATPTPRQREAGDIIPLLNDCAVQVDRAIQLASTVAMLLQAAANPGQPQEGAQSVEDLWRWWLDEATLRYAASGRGMLRNGVSWSGLVLGQYAARVLLRPADPGFPWDFTLMDPRTLFPDTYDGPPGVIVHRYSASPLALERDFGKRRVAAQQGPTGQALAATTPVTCTGFYSDTEMAVAGPTDWLAPPRKHGYGFNPIILVPVGGSPFPGPRPDAGTATSAASPGGGADPWDRWGTGVSFLRAIRPIVEDAQRTYTMQLRLLQKSSDPPTGLLTRQALEGSEVPIDPGTTWTGEPGDQYLQYPPPPQALGFSMNVRTMQQAAVQAAGFNAALLGGGDATAGFDRYLMSVIGTAPLRPYLTAQGLFWTLVGRAVMRLFTRFWPPLQPLPTVNLDRISGATTYNTITPQQVQGADVSFQVKFGEAGPIDTVSMGNLAMGLKREGLAPPRWLLSELLHVDNPIALLRELEEYEVLNQPQVKIIRVTRRLAQQLAQSDPEGAAEMQQLHDKGLEQFNIMTAPQPAQPPLPSLGQPNNAQPNEMGPEAGMPPNSSALAPEQVGAAPQAPPPTAGP